MYLNFKLIHRLLKTLNLGESSPLQWLLKTLWLKEELPFTVAIENPEPRRELPFMMVIENPMWWLFNNTIEGKVRRKHCVYFIKCVRNMKACFTLTIFVAPIMINEPFGNSNMVGTPSFLLSFVGFINKAGNISSQKVQL